MTDLRGRRILVTGAHRGPGAAAAISVATAGAAVVCADRRLSGETVATIRGAGGRAETWQADVTDEDQVTALLDAFGTGADGRGGLDILVHAAGLARDPAGPIGEAAPFDRHMAEVLRGAF